jgi:type I restriction enzyme R subunit
MTSPIDKQSLTERDICTKFITPALQKAGWDIHTQLREEVYITKGRIIVRGRMTTRAAGKFADYILYYKPNIPLAIIEAKDNRHSIGDGMQQALNYAEMIDVPFVFSSNGDGFLAHDRTGQSERLEREISLNEFPSPQELWRRYCKFKGLTPEVEAIVAQDYYTDASGRDARYYQANAVNRTVEAIAKGQDRLLLVMATGSGKTYTAFQIIWRLWKAKVKKRILFLADRNILVDDPRRKDFKPFGKAMTKIKNRKVNKEFEVYLALYQAISGTEERADIFKQFSPEFFDLIVVDECHRGSAASDSAWRVILDYFSSATQIGLTATPKETVDVSTTHYFGDPIYTYTLRQGIEDGFLAPYKVVRVDLDRDLAGWRPERGKRDKFGEEIADRIYNQRDFDRTLVLEQRTNLVARKVTEFLKATDRFDKTIVFCEDIDHAERMRQALVNENADLCAQNRKYVMRITGDNDEGKAELDSFIHPEERFPVVVTTSKLLTTGVDAETCKVIVLDQNISSMTEFKQIVGRGTRVREDFGKLFFTIIDFRKATEHFADPNFDGLPEQIYEPRPDESVAPPDDAPLVIDLDAIGAGADGITNNPADFDPTDSAGKRMKYVVGDVQVSVAAERVQYYSKEGKLITESLKDYVRTAVREEYSSLDAFLKTWTEADRKRAVVQELEQRGVFFQELAREVGKDFSAFDLICHVAFDRPPLTRRERAKKVREKDYFAKYGGQARAVLDALLDKYADEGVDDIENLQVLKVQPLTRFGTPIEIINAFGGKDEYLKAVRELEDALYNVAS